MKREILLAVLVVVLSQSVWAEETLTGTWRYKDEEGIAEYAFLPEGEGVLSVKTQGEILDCRFKYIFQNGQYLYVFMEIPEAKTRGVEISEIEFLSEDRIRSRAVNAYAIEEKDISFYSIQPLPIASEPKHLFNATVTVKQMSDFGPEEQPKILEKVNN